MWTTFLGDRSGKAPCSTWYSFSFLDALSRSDVNTATVALWVIPVYLTLVIVARTPITTMTTRSSTMVKPDLIRLVLRSLGKVGSLMMVKAGEVFHRSDVLMLE